MVRRRSALRCCRSRRVATRAESDRDMECECAVLPEMELFGYLATTLCATIASRGSCVRIAVIHSDTRAIIVWATVHVLSRAC